MDGRSPWPPLVGRDRELALLHDRLTAAQGGRGSLVLIGGEAGIGKTALANALGREAADARRHASSPATATTGPRPRPTAPGARSAGASKPSPTPPTLRPSPASTARRARRTSSRRRATSSPPCRRQRPLVLVLEDLHWADRASLDLLRFVARGLADLPLLLVATYRDEERRPAPSARRARPAPRARGADRAARPAPARRRGGPGAGAGALRPGGRGGSIASPRT